VTRSPARWITSVGAPIAGSTARTSISRIIRSMRRNAAGPIAIRSNRASISRACGDPARLGNAGDVLAALNRYARRGRARTRQVQLVSWAASAALHLPRGPTAQRRDAYLTGLPEHLAWIHGHDVLRQAEACARELVMNRQGP
jgi:hypothetical protein